MDALGTLLFALVFFALDCIVAGTLVWVGGWWTTQDRNWAWTSTPSRTIFLLGTAIVAYCILHILAKLDED